MKVLGIVAGLLLVIASIAYIASILNKKPDKRIKPRPISWFGWAFIMGASLVSQILSKGFEWNQITVGTSVVFCIIIGAVALVVRSYLVKPMDWWCLGLGVICAGIYLSTKNAWMTTTFGVIADFIVAIPTLHNAYVNPESERSTAWVYGALSWALTLIVCIGHSWLYALFPLYLFIMNVVFLYLTNRRILPILN